MRPRIRRRALLHLAADGLVAAAAPGRIGAESPGAPAPEAVMRELHRALVTAIERFQALDAPGVLAHVSEQYRNGAVTKPSVREQLLVLFALYDAVRAQVRLDHVRVVDGAAWIASTGEISGRLRGIGVWTSALAWEHELDVARREGGPWRLVGPGP